MKTPLLTICAWALLVYPAFPQGGGFFGPKLTKDYPKPLRDWVPKDGKTNASGLQPGKERLPPLKRIADPANLESKNPAIKAAAEIKEQEDLKCQKVKALRYLASVGCGCYNEDGKITEALLAAMSDCTEDVRLATVEVIEFAASTGRCQQCNGKKCCDEEVVKKLAQMVYELDDKGCPIEPSARVRAAACKAMYACCPNYSRPMIITPPVEPEKVEPGEAVEGAGTPTESVEPAPLPVPQSEFPAPPVTPDVPNSARLPVGEPKTRMLSNTSRGEVEGVAHVVSANRPQGRVVEVLGPQEAVVIQFTEQGTQGYSHFLVYHRHTMGRISASCDLQVVSIDGYKVTARPTNGSVSMSKIAVGDLVVGTP